MDQTTSPARRRMRWAAVALLGAFSLVAGACGGDDDGGDEASSDSDTGSETAGGGEDFCQAMREIDEQEFAGEEPTADEIRDLMARVSQLDPPPEIAESFNQMVEGMQQALVNPSSAAELADDISQASDEVDAYLQAECGPA